MFPFLKGTFAGAILAFVVSEIVGRLGNTGGVFHVLHFEVDGARLYWSWALFAVCAGLGWVMFALLE
jgi:hypothetical protein